MSYTDNKNQGYDKGYEAFEKFLYMIAERQSAIDEYEKIHAKHANDEDNDSDNNEESVSEGSPVGNDDEENESEEEEESVPDSSPVGNEEDNKTDDKFVSNDDTDYDEFERLLNEFINSADSVPEAPPFGNANDEDEEEDESVPEGSPFGNDEDFEGEDFPTGEIEQNLSLTTKATILRPFRNPRAELDKLIGCDEIKQRMDDLVALSTYNTLRSIHFPKSKQHKMSLHSLFLGSPGTGKTTVCKIYGSLLRDAGALSKGHIVVCDRSTFLGTLWGDEERATNQVIDMAKGGVLMIDEAYLLKGENKNDPGRVVIQLLMNVLADENNRDMAVVLCGYKEPMQKLLDLNPGLRSRFPNQFEFKDFTIEQLLSITKIRIAEYGYHFTPQAWKKYCEVLTAAYKVRDSQTWGNARFVANLLERIYLKHATRCVKTGAGSKSKIRLLTTADIVPIEVPRAKPRIGF